MRSTAKRLVVYCSNREDILQQSREGCIKMGLFQLMSKTCAEPQALGLAENEETGDVFFVSPAFQGDTEPSLCLLVRGE